MQPIAALTSVFAMAIVAIGIIACKNKPIQYPDGGYSYLQHVTAKDSDFYACPLRGVLSKKDSFRAARAVFYYQALNEPNLSLAPYGEDIFRFYFVPSYGNLIIITLTRKAIIVKETNYHDYKETPDSVRLNKTELHLLHILRRHYPIDANSFSKNPVMRHYLDSMIQVIPALTTADYYWMLEAKGLKVIRQPKVKVTTIPIASSDFVHLVSTINASGYWKMPWKIKCDGGTTDGDGWSLEANTAGKYNYVSFGSCDDDTKMQLNFCKACMQLVKYAKMDKEISLLYSDSSEMGPVQIAPTDTTK